VFEHTAHCKGSKDLTQRGKVEKKERKEDLIKNLCAFPFFFAPLR
jgi:hypothetical protein